jgi:hypothetical protein
MKRRIDMKHVLVAMVLAMFTVVPALATPGAVNQAGCHGRHGRMGYHCHKTSDLSTFHTKRQKYVQFNRG